MNSLTPLTRRAGLNRPHRRRSRNGCLTCKRRKVRCNEQKPHCFHCQRLGLECVWKDASAQTSPQKDALAEGAPRPNLAAAALDVDWPTPMADLFDFSQSVSDPADDFSLFQDIYLPDFGDSTAPRHPLHGRVATNSNTTESPPASAQSPRPPLPADADEDSLLQHAPPILDPVENGPICASLRALLDSMAASSPMVRHAITAFAAVQYYTTGEKVDYRVYYDKAARDLSDRFPKSGGGVAFSSNELRYVLTTIFFLTYINVRSPYESLFSLPFANFSGVLDWSVGSRPL